MADVIADSRFGAAKTLASMLADIGTEMIRRVKGLYPFFA